MIVRRRLTWSSPAPGPIVGAVVRVELDGAPPVWPLDDAVSPGAGGAAPRMTDCGAGDPLPAAFAGEAAASSDDPTTATRKNPFMICPQPQLPSPQARLARPPST